MTDPELVTRADASIVAFAATTDAARARLCHGEVLVGRGVVMKRYQWLEQDARGVWLAPSGARVAWIEDPDGNLLSVTQYADE